MGEEHETRVARLAAGQRVRMERGKEGGLVSIVSPSGRQTGKGVSVKDAKENEAWWMDG